MLLSILLTAPTPPVTSEQIFLAYMLGAIGVLLSMGASAAAIWGQFKRSPPLSEFVLTLKTELVENFATKSELDNLRRVQAEDIRHLSKQIEDSGNQRRDDIRSIHEKMEGLKSTLSKDLQDIQRAVGRIEGSLTK